MDQATLTTNDQAASRHEPVTLDRQTANALFDIRWSADDGKVNEFKYPAEQLRRLIHHGLLERVSTGGWRLNARGRLCTVSIDHVSRPVPAAP